MNHNHPPRSAPTTTDPTTTDWARRHRREFLTTVGAAAGLACLPGIATAQKSDSTAIVGTGDYKYEITHAWAQLPSKYNWQTTHNVTVDEAGNLYVIHQGRLEQRDHPAIFVFDADGQFIHAFGERFQGGGHGLEYRREADGEFLYVTAYQSLKEFAKIDLMGEVVWTRYAPMAAGGYIAGDDRSHEAKIDRDRFQPTNTAFLPDGTVVLADGYGSYRMHKYTPAGEWQSCFGSFGTGDGQFNTPHGVWVDNRKPEQPLIVVADRVNARLQWFTPAGEHVSTLGGFILPANVDTHEDLMLVPDLSARVTLLDGDNKIIAHLGDDPEWMAKVMADGFPVRGNPQDWPVGKFIHPHDACFAKNGDILVAEWVHTGRISKLTRLS